MEKFNEDFNPRYGVPENFEYYNRIREVVDDSDEIVLQLTPEKAANIQNVELEAFLKNEFRQNYIEISLLDEEEYAIRRYLMIDESECADSNLAVILRTILSFAPFYVSFKVVDAQKIMINQITDNLRLQMSIYHIKDDFKSVVVDAFDYGSKLIEEIKEEEQEENTGLFSDKKELDGNSIKKQPYKDQYTSCYNLSKEEISDMMYN